MSVILLSKQLNIFKDVNSLSLDFCLFSCWDCYVVIKKLWNYCLESIKAKIPSDEKNNDVCVSL